MKKRRRIIQALVYMGFIFLFLITVYPMEHGILNPFTRISPFAGIMLAIMGKATLLLSLGVLVLVLTALFERFFCGWMCPLGATLDIGTLALGKCQNSPQKKNLSWIKYVVLVVVVLGAFFRFSLVHWFDPVTLAYRFYTFSIFPVIDRVWRYAQDHVTSLSSINLSHSPVSFPAVAGWTFLVLMAGLILLGKHQKRFYCRNICPLGALLSLAARFSLVNKKVGESCVDCGKCTKECKMGAIPEDFREFRVTECVECFSCVKTCPKKAISFALGLPHDIKSLPGVIKAFFHGKPSPVPQTSSGFSRRAFLGGIAAGTVVAATAKATANPEGRGSMVVRPPGAQPEEDFNAACIRCGECMKACITGGLHPSFLEAGTGGIMSPRLIPRKGYCEFQCTLCQQVCPTKAIQPFAAEDKQYIKIGTAEIDRSKCIAWISDQDCLVCDEHCPLKAIYWKQDSDRFRPLVDDLVCIGCGLCENKCPVKGEAAIRVNRTGEKRFLLKPGDSWVKLNPPPDNPPSSTNTGRPMEEQPGENGSGGGYPEYP